MKKEQNDVEKFKVAVSLAASKYNLSNGQIVSALEEVKSVFLVQFILIYMRDHKNGKD